MSRRRTLCAGASFAAALVVLGVSALAPDTALAENECAPVGVDPSANGSAPDTYACASSPEGITYTSDGALTLNFADDTNVGMEGINLVASAGSPITIDNNGGIGTEPLVSNTERVDAQRWADLVIEADGPSTLTIQNDDALRGALDLSGLSGGATLNISATGTWGTVGDSEFSAGADTVSIAAGGAMMTSPGRFVSVVPPGGIATTIDFLGGADVFNNAGTIFLGESWSVGRSGNTSVPKESITTFLNLDAFNNSGLIMFGREDFIQTNSDFMADDTLAMPGVTFTGMEGSTLLMDVTMSIGGQTSCAARVADCLDLTGGATAGVTSIIIRDTAIGDRGDTNPVMLIDVSGGTSAQGHFVIDPASDNYDPRGVINKGLLIFPLLYDEATGHHALVGLPSNNALQLAAMVQSARHVWQSATGSWFDRQGDLRYGLGGPDAGGGGWVRFTHDTAERDLMQSSQAGGNTFTYDNSFSQDGYAATVGVDLIAASAEDQGLVVGVMAGYTHSEIEYEQSPNHSQLDGFVGGVYGSYLAGPMFVDAIFSGAGLVMHNDIPALNLFPAGTLIETDVSVIGARVEAGWRIDLSEAFFVEPTAGLSYSRAKFEDVNARSADVARAGNTLTYDDATSLRAGIGGRVGLDVDHGAVQAQYSLRARAWNEFDGEAGATLQSSGPSVQLADEFAGASTEVALGVALFSPDRALSAFADISAGRADNFSNTAATTGFRFRW
ncbi:MAG TPA: autotransporter outer membrane beta-barrel domain-containing protein [Caulobacteraceae bacterium]|nr:autotransporter outer membrane beta-barrel domain-containing protein [Caulobacteraceae bacterium]